MGGWREVVCEVQQQCGGCPHLNSPLEREHQIKRTKIADALGRHGIDAPVSEVVDPGPPVGYRNRIRMRVDDGRVGLFNSSKPFACAVLHPRLKLAIDELVPATNSAPNLLAGVRHLEVRISDADNQYGLILSDPVANPDRVSAALPHHWLVSHLGAHDQPTLTYDLGAGVSMDVPLDSFVQINSEVNRALVGHVINHVPHDVTTFIDLYAGAGNFSLPLLRAGLTGTAVEQSPSATSQLAHSTQHQRLDVTVGAVEAANRSLPAAGLVVVNPARAGLKETQHWIADRATSALFYISCRPETLALDLVALTANGLHPYQITPFNMFPGTNHVETVTILHRPGTKAPHAMHQVHRH